jgi:hypothetical protein
MNDIARKTVLFDLPGTAAVTVRTTEVDRPDGPLVLDCYAPPAAEHPVAPVVGGIVIAAGYPDPGFERIVGCRFKDMGSTTSWARLIAASGMVALTYTNRAPAADLEAVLRHVHANAAALGIDPDRIGLWASSGNAPVALSALMTSIVPLARAVLCYPYTLDLDASTDIATVAARFGFATASGSVADLPSVPLFIARAGQDEMPNLNATLDRFIAAALGRNLPITLVNHPEAPHAFDLFVESPSTRTVVRQILDFLSA